MLTHCSCSRMISIQTKTTNMIGPTVSKTWCVSTTSNCTPNSTYITLMSSYPSNMKLHINISIELRFRHTDYIVGNDRHLPEGVEKYAWQTLTVKHTWYGSKRRETRTMKQTLVFNAMFEPDPQPKATEMPSHEVW